MSGRSSKELAGSTDPRLADLRALVRRVAVKTAAKAVAWLVTGAQDAAGALTSFEAEVFHGVGFYSRPAAGGKPEAIVVNVGASAKVPVIVATRDHAGLKAVLEQLGGPLRAGEVLIYAGAGKAVVYLKDDGTVEIRLADGTAAELATKAEVKALRDFVATLLYGGTGSAVVPDFPDITGTTVLKGQ